jgi:hypothetical protein
MSPSSVSFGVTTTPNASSSATTGRLVQGFNAQKPRGNGFSTAADTAADADLGADQHTSGHR